MHKNEFYFLNRIVLAQKVQIEDKRIEVIKNWFEPKLIKNIQVFHDFANFYWLFIQGFSKIAGSLGSMLKITRLAKNILLSITKNDTVDNSDNDCEDEAIKRLLCKNSNTTAGYLTPKARLALAQLRKMFTKAEILEHFNL